MEYNIYCDESCHLEHDKSNSMSLGAIYCRKDKLKEINNNILIQVNRIFRYKNIIITANTKKKIAL